jgi:3-oxoacyl-[acyl-carrier protein] reductase
MKLNLLNKRAIICGASQGIGAASAQALAAEGVNVTLLARSEDKLSALAKELEEKHSVSSDYIAVDINNTSALRVALEAKVLEHGFYNILVNNSGGPAGGPILNTPNEDFLTYFQNHIIGNQTLVNILLPSMQREKYGRIINIISTSVKQPIPNLGASNTIRGAVASWAKTLSHEVGPHVTVNNVLPGFTLTPRLHALAEASAKRLNKTKDEIFEMWKNQAPARRLAEPSEVASAIVYLASDRAGFINGINLPVDGGRLTSL